MSSFTGWTDTWNAMKQTATPEEKKEMLQIEKRHNSKPVMTPKVNNKKTEGALNAFGKDLIKNAVIHDGINPADMIVHYDPALSKPNSPVFRNNKRDIVYGNINEARQHNAIWETYDDKTQIIKRQLNERPGVKKPSPTTPKPFVKKPVAASTTTFKSNSFEKPNVSYQLAELKEMFKETPEQKLQRENFERIQEQNKREKLRLANSGISYLLGGAQNIERQERMNAMFNPQKNKEK